LPPVKAYNPVGIPPADMQEVVFKVEEIEAIRLKNHLNLEQEDCARMMEVSRPTFQRILTEAYAKVADAFANGKAIRIEGGSYCLGPGHCRRRERQLDYMEGCRFFDSGLELNSAKKSNVENNRIAVCAEGSDLSNQILERFGKCNCFWIWDPINHSFSLLDIPKSNTDQGQGTIGAKTLVQAGVNAVIVNRIGPKAFLILQRANITIYNGANEKSVTEAVQMFQNQELNKLESPNG
jgi:predicted DNA-binding protein (UPF0251 family)/predicted Fe-Mo cluster-binding NifX family protein